MTTKEISGGVAHEMPAELKKALLADSAALAKWEDITPLSRNEWICWNLYPKKQETRDDHLRRTISELKEGVRRPCCWVGCVHRTDKAISATQKWVMERRESKK